MSLRLETPQADLAVINSVAEPTLFILWHNRLFLAAEVARRHREGRRLYSLISASKDGSWLEAYFSMAGLHAVRGSSSRNGREAATALVNCLRAGNDVGITPDGPRGPVYEMKPGAVIVARATRQRVVLVGMDFESSLRLSSWDGFHLPRPFSRVHMRYVVLDAASLGDRDEAAADIGRRLAAINPDRRPIPPRRRA